MGSEFDSNGRMNNPLFNDAFKNNPANYAKGTQFYTDPMSGQRQSVYFGSNPEDRMKAQQYLANQQGIGMTQQFSQQAQQGANQIGTDFNKFVPQLQQNFQQYNPNIQTNFAAKPGLDAFSQGLLSQGQQQINRGLGATQAQIARSVQGPSAGVLQSQAAMQSRLNANPLLFQVGAQQVGRQQQEQLLGNQASLAQSQERARLQQLGNEAAIGQQGAYNTGLSASNQAQALKLGMQGLPLQANTNLISTLQAQKGK